MELADKIQVDQRSFMFSKTLIDGDDDLNRSGKMDNR